jgi:hypothetical protein
MMGNTGGRDDQETARLHGLVPFTGPFAPEKTDEEQCI